MVPLGCNLHHTKPEEIGAYNDHEHSDGLTLLPVSAKNVKFVLRVCLEERQGS